MNYTWVLKRCEKPIFHMLIIFVMSLINYILTMPSRFFPSTILLPFLFLAKFKNNLVYVLNQNFIPIIFLV